MPQALGLVETKGLVAAIEAADAMVKAANVKFVGKEVIKPAMITIKVVGDTAAVRSAVDAGAVAANRVGQLISTHIIPQPDNQLIDMLPEIGDRNKSINNNKKEDIEKPKKETTAKNEVATKVETKSEKKAEPEEKAKEPAKEKVARKKPAKKEPEKIVEIVEDEPEVETGNTESPSDTITRLRNEALGIKKEKNKIQEEKTEEKPEPEDQGNELDEDIESLNVHKLRHLARSIPDFPIKGREISRANRDILLQHFRKLKK